MPDALPVAKPTVKALKGVHSTGANQGKHPMDLTLS